MAEAEGPDRQWPVYLDKKCAICEVNEITFRCLNCEELLCDSCKKMHLKSKMAKKHKVVCLETAEIYQSSDIKTKCSTHATEDLIIYCETCKLPICRDCIASGSHHKHQMSKIENVIDNKQKELAKLITESKEKSSKYEDVVKTIDKSILEFSLNISQTIEQVKARTNQLRSKLDKIESDYIRQLKDTDSKNKKDKTELRQRFQREVTDLNDLIHQCEVKQRIRNIEMIQFVPDVTQRLDKFESHEPLENTSPPTLVVRDDADEKLKILFGYLDTKTTKIDHLLPKKRNIPSASPAIDVKVVNSFASTDTHVVAVDNDQAWLWSNNDKCISLVTSNGKVIQKIKTDCIIWDAAVSTSGDLFVTVWLGNKVKKLTRNNKFTDIFTADGYKTQAITVTDAGNVLVGLYMYKGSKIVEITTSGQHIRTIQHDTVDNKLLFNYLWSICTNINGDIIVADDFNEVVSVNKFGTKRFIYGEKEKKLKTSLNAECVVTDRYGNIMISDCDNSVVHMINQDGKFLQYLITPEQGCVRPYGMSIDTSGRLWVCNKGENKVVIVKYL